MKLTPIQPNNETFPAELQEYFAGADVYDSSCSELAQVIFIDKGEGFFLKSAPKDALRREVTMTRYFHDIGMASDVLVYIVNKKDWMLTTKVHGEDGAMKKHTDDPKRLCDIFAERLAILHATDFSDCPIINHTALYLESAKNNMLNGTYNKSNFPDSWGYASANEAWAVVEKSGHLLKTDTLLHGDYCLPNIILNNWKFAGFIDIDQGGVGDRHVDIFWALWSLNYNLKTHDYRQRFIDAYGRDNVDEDMLRVVAAVEVFG